MPTGSATAAQGMSLPNPKAEMSAFTFSMKKLAYLKYSSSPRLMATESASSKRFKGNVAARCIDCTT